MKLITAYKKIRDLGVPIVQTNDIAIILSISRKYGSKLLKQLSDEDLIIHLGRGIWAIKEIVDPLMIPDYLTAPNPSYISLQSALYYHGLISQIPSIVYAVTLARTKRYHTPIGIYSLHHINPKLFSGFEITIKNQIGIATAEKALFDFFYFKSAKSKLFFSLTEVYISEKFEWNLIEKYIKLISNKSRQSMISSCLERLRYPH